MSTWQSMMRISESQIKEIEANPDLLDVFFYTVGMRNRMEQLADMQDRGTHDIFQTQSGYIVAPKNSGVRLIPPTVPWYRRLWNIFTFAPAPQPSESSKPVKIERPAPPTIPNHWPPFESSNDRYNLDQEFDLVFYLFSDSKLPGTYPLNFMLVPKHQMGTLERGCFYLTAAEVGEVVVALDTISEETLRQRYENKGRLESLGCGHASEWEGTEYDEVIGVMIDEMRRFLLDIRRKGDGILITLN